ncbi:UvrD-helicase domain-containing protein [Nocardioides sp. BYT-33-1]|uniref:UvrD-helicase domain-containing protein n=1 Tax=Nocardioides sp. BYT-33-1 TaxID=3416952 RepID=UPI003F5347E1
MTTSEGLSEEQAAALAPEVRHIEAGPGSGKTRTIVARFRQRSGTSRGVALLSFTNAAIDVARSRCVDAPHLLGSPNYIGTFDGFFHRYVVTPAVVGRTGMVPRYVSSWDDLPDPLSVVRLPSGGQGVRLSRWERTAGGVIELNEERLGHGERTFLGNIRGGAQNALRQKGVQRVTSLLDSHLYSASEARRVALELIADQTSDLLPRLSRRFSEVIVDEFQDCDHTEHDLLETLERGGIHVVTVADPDQGIYEFRRADTDPYHRRTGAVTDDDTVNLTTCYRSTDPICKLVTSLRCISVSEVSSHCSAGVETAPIEVVVGGGAAARTAAIKIIQAAGIAPTETRVIAHRKAEARRLANAAKSAPDSAAKMTTLLVALLDLRNGSDARTRKAAMNRVVSTILDLVDWGETGPPQSQKEQLDQLGVTADQVRILASRIVTASSGWTEASECASEVRAIIKAGATSFSRPMISTLSNQLSKPRKNVWDWWTACTASLLPADAVAVKWAHVHAVKGAEFDAVIYAIPSRASDGKHVLDDWKDGRNTEARRVLYVGVSRARKIAVLVVPPSRESQLLEILERDGVPHHVTRTT